MAKMYVKEGSYQGTKRTLECQEFYLETALKYQNSSQSGLKIIVQNGSLEQPFVGIRMSGTASSFPITEAGISYRINLFDMDNMVAPFVEDLKLGVNIRKSANDEYGNVTWINPNPVTLGVKPADWDTNWRNYYWVDSGNRWMPNTSSEFIGTRQHYHPGDHLKMLYVTDGLIRFNFGVATRISYMYASDPAYRNVPFSGMRQTYAYRDYIGDDTDDLNFKNTQGNFLVRNNTINIKQSVTGGTQTAVVPAGTQSILAQSYPVHFVLPAGMHIGSKSINEPMSTSSNSSFTPTKNTAFFGVLTVEYDYDGFPVSWVITAMEATVWKSSKQRQNDYGDDTTPTGGQGPQKIGKFDPRSNITRARNGGVLTDPTAGKGFVIYKMTQAEFTRFMQGIYNQLALPSWALSGLDAIGSTDAMTNILAQLVWNQGQGAGSKALSNIVFVKNSPVDFPSVHHNLGRISLGSQGIAATNIEPGGQAIPYSVDVVQGNTMEFTVDVGYDNNANSFTDVEPYKTANIYCPLVGEMQVMPSYLENARITGTVGFNLLNDAAVCALQIQGDNGVIRISKSGQCTKPADVVLTGDGTADALSKLIPTAAVGAATIATGGTTTTTLATTAVGAATGFIEDATTMNVVNVPSGATGNAYDECVYGGLRTMYLTSVKAERFVSGEAGRQNERAYVMGEYSYTFIPSIADIADNNFASFIDVNLSMQDGMTKAEYDKIISYLHEGVYF